MLDEYRFIIETGKKNIPNYRKLVFNIRKKPPRFFDERIHDLNAEAFEKIDCLKCGNCCRTLGPRLTDRDISQLAKALRISPGTFTDDFLKIDEDRDYVFSKMPCPFINDTDNYCKVYGKHPQACNAYPHLEENRMHQRLDFALKNLSTCPIVAYVFERLHQESKI